MNMTASEKTIASTPGTTGAGKKSKKGSTKGSAENHGKRFEDRIIKAGALLEAARVLVIRKVDPPTATIRIKGRPVVIQKKSPFLDFHGAAVSDGRAIVIEAKSTSERRLPIRTKKSGVTEEQFQSLRVWYWAGCWTGILWECRPMEKVFWIPYNSLRKFVENYPSRKSIEPGWGDEVEMLPCTAYPNLQQIIER
jgi:penicillin-binding protein-related factor A (putative recombinase)